MIRAALTGRHGARRPAIVLALLALLAGLACNLVSGGPTVTPPSRPTAIPAGPPQVSVLWPPSGSEFVVRSEVAVRVSATDSVGITRIELRSATTMLSSVPSPERNGQPAMDAILSWTPTRAGQHDLQVVAYRRSVPSEPIPLTLIIRRRSADVLATPVPFGVEPAATPAGPGIACQVRVNIGNLRYRSGPGTGYDILGLLDLGEILAVTGQNAARTWYRIDREGQIVWVSADPGYSTALTSCAAAPIVD